MKNVPVLSVPLLHLMRQGLAGLLLAAGFSAPVLAGTPPPLRLIISDSIPPPYLITSKGAVAGMATDLCRAVATRLGYAPVLTVVPSKRVPEMIKARDADMLCHVSPDWYPDPGSIEFGTPMYVVRNVFVGPASQPPICDDCAPSGEVVTVIGYVYGDGVNRAFADGTARRRDVRTEEGVYTMVRRGRAPLGILSEQTFHYLGGKNDGLSVKGVTARFTVTMGVTKVGPVSAADLRRVTAELAQADTSVGQ